MIYNKFNLLKIHKLLTENLLNLNTLILNITV